MKLIELVKKLKIIDLDLGQFLCEYLGMRKITLAVILVASLFAPVSAQAATAKAGASCPKVKTTQIVGSKKFTCVKSGKKLVWNKGVAIPKPFAICATFSAGSTPRTLILCLVKFFRR